MREFTLIIPKELDGAEIKYILRNNFHVSERLITKLKSQGKILLNGKREYVIKTVSEGDTLKIVLPPSSPGCIVPKYAPLDILYEDEDILAVNKPAGMPTHPSVRHFEDTLANAVMYYYKDTDFTFRAVSRLDRDTTGVTVIAKNAVCADLLSKIMRKGDFKKEYTALCVGIPEKKKGRIDAPIRRSGEGIIKRCVAPDGKPALSDYEVIGEKDGFSLLRLFPKTGRTHQLRLHLSHIGTPILGDFMYGTEIPGERIRLHCKKVEFPHPFTGETLSISAPLPDDMKITP